MQREFTRVGAVAAIAGALTLFTATVLHPMSADPSDPAAACAEYAADSRWVASHLGQFLGVPLLGAALVALAGTVATGRASGWAQIGVAGTAASVAATAVLGIGRYTGRRGNAMNLIVGATGMLGGEICRLLSEQGKPVRALVRDTSTAEKVARLKDLGAEVVHGDLKDRASLDAACRGASAVVSTASSTLSRQEGDSIESVDQQGQLNLLQS